MFLLVSFGPPKAAKNDDSKLEKEIQALSADQEKSDFLYKLWQEDQELRSGDESEIISQFGYPSKVRSFLGGVCY